jgi:DNA-binding transcriptional ArsR family regulator
MPQEITIATQELKALASESRTKILKNLNERNHTLSELSTKLNMTPPTIKQHIKILMNCGLIELIDEGRKWKYYTLTKKGKQILKTNETNSKIFILLSATIILGIMAIAMLFLYNNTTPMQSAQIQKEKWQEKTNIQTNYNLETNKIQEEQKIETKDTNANEEQETCTLTKEKECTDKNETKK